MTAAALHEAIAAGRAPGILDVRTAREYAEGHVPGAANVPFNEIARRVGEIAGARREPLVVYCGHGPRAWIAARALRRAGFARVEFLKGHWAAWRRAGCPVARSP